jgi:uncharacterized membrane protein
MEFLKKHIVALPLVLLLVYSLVFVWGFFIGVEVQHGPVKLTMSAIMSWKHYLGYGLMLVAFTVYFSNRKVFKIFTTFLLALASVNLLQFSPGESSFSMSIGNLETFGIDVIMFLLFLLHLVCNIRSIASMKPIESEKNEISTEKESFLLKFQDKSIEELEQIVNSNFREPAILAATQLLEEKSSVTMHKD